MPGPSKTTANEVTKLYKDTKQYQSQVSGVFKDVVNLLKEQNRILVQIRDKLPPVDGNLPR